MRPVSTHCRPATLRPAAIACLWMAMGLPPSARPQPATAPGAADDYSNAWEVSADFGGALAGITLLDRGPSVGYVPDTVGGRRCVRTDGAQGKHWLAFDVANSFAFQGGGAMTLAIEYYDFPAGLLTVRYDATDQAGGPMAQVFRTVRTGQQQWVTLCLPLEDCFLGGRMQEVGDIGMAGYTWTGDPRAADVAVAGIAVLCAAMDLKVTPDVVPAYGADDARRAEVTATLWEAPLVRPPDGQEVTFEVQGREEAETVLSAQGKATFAFAPDPEPGRVVVTARWGRILKQAAVSVYPAETPLAEQEVLLLGFEAGEQFESLTPSAGASLTDLDPTILLDGQSSLRIEYDFEDPPTQGQPRVIVHLDQELPGLPRELLCDVYGDGSEHALCFTLVDAQGESFSFVAGHIKHQQWGTMRSVISEAGADDHWGDQANGLFDLPLRLYDIRLMKAGPGNGGTVYLDDLRAVCMVPEDQ